MHGYHPLRSQVLLDLGGKPDAKENKPDIKIKKPEFAAPKNPANNESHSTMEKEVGNSSVSTARNLFTFTALLPPSAGLCNLCTGKALSSLHLDTVC